MQSIPGGEEIVISADLSGHIGVGNRGDEVVHIAKIMEMAVANSFSRRGTDTWHTV